MKRRIVLLIVMALTICTLFAGGKQETLAAGEKPIIKLGVLAPLTGTNAEYGKGFEVATQMAVERINAKGGVNGYKLELIVKDSKGDPKESSDLCRQFCDDDEVYAIIGDFTSGCCMANAPIVDAAGIVQLSPTASHPDYAAMSEYCFSIMGRQDSEAPFFARYIAKKYMGLDNIGLIYINSDWGVSCYENFKKEADKIGLNIVAAVNYVQDEKDFSSLITKLRAANPQAVLIMDQGAVPQVINQIRGAGWNVPLATLGPGTSEQLLKLAGKNAEGLIVSTPFFFDENNAELMAWKNEFAARAGFEPTIHPVCAYDCVYLIAAAIEACGDEEVTRKTIRDNLAKVEFEGVSGPIKFNINGDVTRDYMICAAENGKWVVKAGYDYVKE